MQVIHTGNGLQGSEHTGNLFFLPSYREHSLVSLHFLFLGEVNESRNPPRPGNFTKPIQMLTLPLSFSLWDALTCNNKILFHWPLAETFSLPRIVSWCWIIPARANGNGSWDRAICSISLCLPIDTTWWKMGKGLLCGVPSSPLCTWIWEWWRFFSGLAHCPYPVSFSTHLLRGGTPHIDLEGSCQSPWWRKD